MSEIDYSSELSQTTLAALQEFLQEQQEKVTNEQPTIEENWQLSQFWYDEETIQILVNLVRDIGIDKKIALISCPTLYKELKNVLNDEGEVCLYEYDDRFKIYGNDFIKYDYRSPLDIPQSKQNYYDLVLADPPFLSEECLGKTAKTIKYLMKDKIILCTGAVMEHLAEKILNVQKSVKFVPKHKNNLGNDFACYSNFDIDQYF